MTDFSIEYEMQKRMYKHLIPIGEKSFEEIVSFLKSKVDVRELSVKTFPPEVLNIATYNAENCILNNEHRLSAQEMCFSLFQVIKSKKSLDYYPDNEVFVYVIIEKHIKYIMSNSDKLFLELELFKGVTEKEYETEGLQFRSLLSYLANNDMGS